MFALSAQPDASEAAAALLSFLPPAAAKTPSPRTTSGKATEKTEKVSYSSWERDRSHSGAANEICGEICREILAPEELARLQKKAYTQQVREIVSEMVRVKSCDRIETYCTHVCMLCLFIRRSTVRAARPASKSSRPKRRRCSISARRTAARTRRSTRG